MNATTSRVSVAIVEDHDDLREGFLEFLKDQQFEVSGLSCGEELDEHLALHQPSILILDIGLPGEDGFEISERIRKSHPKMYIVILTALAKECDKIKGYKSGADIYLPKPVSPAELNAALQAAVRRLGITESLCQSLRLDISKSALISNDKVISLNIPERSLLKALSEAKDGIVPTWRLIEILCAATETEIEKAYLELQIFRLRKKLAEAGAPKPAIQALWKEGYKLHCAIEIVGY